MTIAHISRLLLAAAALVAASPVLADVKAGVDAWARGDYDAAVREWRGPASAGDADAQFNLAQAYRLGRGVDQDLDQAELLYARAAEQGHVKASDNYGLLLFQSGRQAESMPYVASAADRGDSRAQYLLGIAHFNGELVEKDWVRAYALLTLANAAGLPQAPAATAQMDEFIPLGQRQSAQVLAQELKRDADVRRTQQLAALDLAIGEPAAPDTGRDAAEMPLQASTSPPLSPEPAAATEGPWRVQLGAFGVHANADRLWNRLAGDPALAGKRKIVEPAGKVVRLQAGGFASKAAAQEACDRLRKSGQACLVTR